MVDNKLVKIFEEFPTKVRKELEINGYSPNSQRIRGIPDYDDLMVFSKNFARKFSREISYFDIQKYLCEWWGI
ncbi:hypothetical protein K9L16_01720 [Candidatus Pacearchaeota archaeon]|nr:hypothetical protein [Candidatus Pacearchaeota archaeon]